MVDKKQDAQPTAVKTSPRPVAGKTSLTVEQIDKFVLRKLNAMNINGASAREKKNTARLLRSAEKAKEGIK